MPESFVKTPSLCLKSRDCLLFWTMHAMPLFLIVLMAGFTSRGQEISIKKYLDKDLHVTSKKHAVYQAVAVADGNHWVLQAMYPDGGLLLRMSFADKQLTIKDGLYTIYHV